jgi:hypothetical protein
MAEDVRQNLAVAEQLLRLAPPDAAGSPPELGGDGNRPPQSKQTTRDTPRVESKGARPGAEVAKAEAQGESRPTDRPPPPGAGSLPPLPDAEPLVDIAPQDLDAHLRRAVDRIAATKRERLRSKEVDKTPGYPDW